MLAANKVRVLAQKTSASLIVALAACALPTLASAQAANANPTFSRDVVPILQENCQTCHRQGGMAPMPLQTYQQSWPFAQLIKMKTTERSMPPWHIDRNIGIQSYQNDKSLSDAEIATLAAWADAGAPEGNPADMPPALEFADASEWSIGEPDLVVKWEYTVPASGPDLYGDLYTDDLVGKMVGNRYIKAIQTRTPDDASRRVVHHALSYAEDGTGNANTEDSMFLVEYASGKSAEFYPDDSGVLLEKDAKVRLSYHLHPVGVETKAVVEQAFVFHPVGYEPEFRRWSKQLGQRMSALDIPAGEVVRTDGYVYFHKNARITAFQPHMHGLGKYQCLELIYPNEGATAKTEIVSCAHWDYNWHTIYNYTDDVAPLVPAGTVGHMISFFDNTVDNPGNHDARNWTGDGGRTIDEMSFSWLGWVDLTDEQYEEALEQRKSMRSVAGTQ
jgi:cytochrome c553